MAECNGKCEGCPVGGGKGDRAMRGEMLLFACSGGANVAEVADQLARGLMEEGWGSMYCLAGLASGIPGMLQTARNARLNVLIDGCGLDCGRRIFEVHGLTNYRQIRLTELGIEKTKSRRARPQEISAALEKVRRLLTEGCLGTLPPAAGR